VGIGKERIGGLTAALSQPSAQGRHSFFAQRDAACLTSFAGAADVGA